MNNKTFLQLSKEQNDPFKALFYFELSRLDASDYDKATALMTEERREIYDRCNMRLEFEAELLEKAREYIAISSLPANDPSRILHLTKWKNSDGSIHKIPLYPAEIRKI